MGPWVIALVGVLIVAAGLAVPIKGPGGISNSRDDDPAPRRSVPVIVVGFVVVAVGVLVLWQPWSQGEAKPPAATESSSSPAPVGKGWINGEDLVFPPNPWSNSELDLSKPAAGPNVDSSVSALTYAYGYKLVSGANGDVFGYAPNPPGSAADCIAQAQRQQIVELPTVLSGLMPLDSPYLKDNDAFCVSDKAGYVAWMRYVGATTGDTQGERVLRFKIRIWKPGS